MNSSETFISRIIGYYLVNTLTISGCLLNFICILIFYKIIKQEQNNQGHLYKYLLLKSICDFMICIVNIPLIIYCKEESELDDSFIMQVWFIGGYCYLYRVFIQMSIWFEIFALIDCFCLVSRKFQFHKSNMFFYSALILLTIIFLVFYLSNILGLIIVRNINGGFEVVDTHSSTDIFFDYFISIHTITRDLLPILISILMNTLILFYIKRTTNNRKRIAFMNSRILNNQTRLMIEKSINAERNKIKMIIVTSCMHLLHLPTMFINFNFLNSSSNPMIVELCYLFLQLYFVIPIVSYVAFNKIFRKYISDLFLFHRC
jgi:hypothetical protein